MTAMPDAFLYTYDGTADGSLHLFFKPNPAYNPRPMRPASITRSQEKFGFSRRKSAW